MPISRPAKITKAAIARETRSVGLFAGDHSAREGVPPGQALIELDGPEEPAHDRCKNAGQHDRDDQRQDESHNPGEQACKSGQELRGRLCQCLLDLSPHKYLRPLAGI